MQPQLQFVKVLMGFFYPQLEHTYLIKFLTTEGMVPSSF